MIELEVYAAGLRNIDKILELDHQLETIPGLRYKVDRSHDLVCLEMEEEGITMGEVVLLAADTFRSAFTHRLRCRLFLQQIVEIGLLSQVVVIVTGGFTGAVFAAQTYFQFNKIGMGSATGAVVSVAICRELAPVLSALMVSGRVGAAMSAEIGTMKVTEQIDALG